MTTLFLMLISGALLFWYFGLGPELAEVEATEGHSLMTSTNGDEMEELKNGPAYALQGETASSQRPQMDEDPVTRGMADPDEIPANLIARVRRNSLKADGTLSDSLVKLLSLNPDQVSFLNEHIRATADRLMEDERGLLKLVQVSENEVELYIPALADSEQLEAQFQKRVIEFLGESEGRLFLDLIQPDHMGYFDGFGRFDRTIRFSVEPREDGGFRVEFRQESPPEQVRRYYAERGRGISGEVGMGRGFMALFPLRLKPPRALGRSAYLLDILPADMRYFFEEIERSALEE